MDILMIGAGGIGGFLAAKLIPAGHRVFLLARGAHLEAIRRDALKLVEGGGETVVHPAAISDDLPRCRPPIWPSSRSRGRTLKR